MNVPFVGSSNNKLGKDKGMLLNQSSANSLHFPEEINDTSGTYQKVNPVHNQERFLKISKSRQNPNPRNQTIETDGYQ